MLYRTLFISFLILFMTINESERIKTQEMSVKTQKMVAGFEQRLEQEYFEFIEHTHDNFHQHNNDHIHIYDTGLPKYIIQ